MTTHLKFLLIILITLNLVVVIIFIKKDKSFEDDNRKHAVICGRFPKEEHITIDNLIWQILETPKGFVKILNAYLDERQNKTVVRVNVNSVEINTTMIFCQFWFDETSPPFVVQASEVHRIRSKYNQMVIKLN